MLGEQCELKTVAVFRALQLGDMLCAVPALRALRQAAPQAHIVLIGLPWAADFARRFRHYIDEFIAFPGFPSMPEQPMDWSSFPDFLREMQRRRFDLLIQLHGSGTLSNPLAMLFGAQRVAGFYLEGQYCPDTATFLPWIEEEHEIRRFLRLMAHLGAPARGEQLEFPFIADGRIDLAAGPYVCIHPGARMPSRRWLPRGFASVADRLADDSFRVVLTGTKDEAALTRAVAECMHAPVFDLCGKTSMDGVATLLENAALLVSNDTGVSHIAAALGTPSAVIACGSDFRRWAPLDRERHAVVAAEVGCRPCMHDVCPIGHPCAREVSADMVYGAALHVLPPLRPTVPTLRTGSTR